MLRAAIRLLAIYPIALAAFGVLAVVVRIEYGPLAIVSILWVHLSLISFLLVPFAIAVREPPLLRIGLVGLALMLVLRAGGEWLSFPAMGSGTVDGREIQIVTWNVQTGSDPDAVVAVLREHPADLVGLQELTPDVAAAIEADPWLSTHYPFRSIEPRDGVKGIGLLSRWEIASARFADQPSRQVATLSIDGRTLDVVNAHPLHARMAVGPRGIPIDYDPAERDSELRRIRDVIDARLAAGANLLVIGDFNTAPTEPAFAPLIAGLHDAHAEVGFGPGWTYGSRFLEFEVGLLRIDLALGGPGVIPVSIDDDCAGPSDHCLVAATFVIGSSTALNR